MSLDSKYAKALTLSSACLAVKIGIVHLLTARERLISGNFAQKQDAQHWFWKLLQVILVCIEGTGFGGAAFIERAERSAKGAAENEPFFLALATTVGLTNAVPASLGVTLINVYTASRCGRTISFLMGEKLNTAFRTTSFIGGLASTFAMAGLAVRSIVKA